MKQEFILDSNVFLYDPDAVQSFSNCVLLVPLEVIEEIDRFKHDSSETGRNARNFIKFIDALREKGSLREGVELNEDCLLKITSESYRKLHKTAASASDAILSLALVIRENNKEAIIISKNMNLRVKADALGLIARDYEPKNVLANSEIKGWQRLELSAEQIAFLKNGNALSLKAFNFHPNEYVFAKEKDQIKNAICARASLNGKELLPIMNSTQNLCGIRSLNIEQTFAIDALTNEDISLVTLSGKAGTGKTLLAIAAGLKQIFVDNLYQKLLVFRPTLPVSRDLGYLPGDLSEKMLPWMQPVFDALDFIRSQDRKNPARVLPNDIMHCPEVSVEPLTYIRGRSIPNQFIIIDEAQNLTPLEVKTVVTRVGSGSKIILTGDPEQIDTPYLDARSNGLTCLVERFLESPLAAHISLQKGERSKLAETAAMLL